MADKSTITCPHCKVEFELSDAIATDLREHMREEFEAESAARVAELTHRHAAELVTAREAAASEALSKQEVELKAAQAALENASRENAEFREQELALRKERNELQNAKQQMELELQRQLDERTVQVEESVRATISEQHRIKDLEKDKTINDLNKLVDEMKRKGTQGSMENQGEALELDFEAQLQRFFLHDLVEPVPKGIRGADLVQTVRTPAGAECGGILWEIKNTKAWSDDWPAKLKADMGETHASIAILVATAMPAGVTRFGQYNGIWVTDSLSALPLASALREAILALHGERLASVGKAEKMEMMYGYLTGNEFRQRIEGIVGAFTGMQIQLEKERRSMERQWKERDKQLQLAIKNAAGMYGDMQGIVGGQIPAVAALELDGGAADVSSKSTDLSGEVAT